jgi:diguanylate cyclase (GGDEF)-like protein/PAS domain S-box-containing protein
MVLSVGRDAGFPAEGVILGAWLTGLRSALRSIWKPTNVPAALAILAILGVAILAENQSQKLHRERLRTEVLSQVSLVRAKLEGNLTHNLELVRGLVSTIAAEPNMSQSRFSELAATLLGGRTQIRNISVAPDLVVSMVYPLEGNAHVLGLDYRKNPVHREMALRARHTGRLVLAGPVTLKDGQNAFIGRYPVLVDNGRAGGRFWGTVSATMPVDRLFRKSGLLDPDAPIELAVVGRDGKGRTGERFFGEDRTLASDPVLTDVVFPSGSWTIAAVPKGGWDQQPPSTWPMRLVVLAGGLLVLIPAVATGRLIEARSRTVHELRQRETQLEHLSRRLKLALDSSEIGVWELNTQTNELFWDDRVNGLFGYPADGGPRTYSDWERSVHPDDLKRVIEQTQADDGGAVQVQYRVRRPDGSTRYLRETAKAYTDEDGSVHIVGVNWDVTTDVLLNQKLKRAKILADARNAELHAAKARLEFNSLHDSLTRLPNRRWLDGMLADHVRAFDSEGERAALLHLDLDRFKQINDTLGHAAGDAILMRAAEVLKSNMRPGDFVARVGGDEFVILCKIEDADRERWSEMLSVMAERIIERMQQPVLYEGHECRVGVSIGIACDLDQLGDPRRLLVNSDLALYRAKNRGRGRYQFFNDALLAEIVKTKRRADEILSGLERGEFVAHYQPQFDAATYAIVGVEALVRWNHPVEGLLPPSEFIKIAEELNVLAAIDRIVLEQVLRDMDEWESEGLEVPKASVNVSARRLNDEELISSLRELSIKRGTIAFELVESIFLDENDEELTWNVDQIKALGIDIEIDDFGTGYTSIVSLLKLKPRRLKIDRQLVTPILTSPTQRHLVAAISDIGASLGIEVLAEGVETLEHARMLQTLGCDALQGHAFAAAMSAAKFKAFARERKLRAAS